MRSISLSLPVFLLFIIFTPTALAADFSPNDFSNDFDIGVGGLGGLFRQTTSTVSAVAETIGISVSLLAAVFLAVIFIGVLAVWYVKETR